MATAAYQHMQYYHGWLPREELANLLINEGDFLVRSTQREGKDEFIISTMTTKGIKHFPVLVSRQGHYRLEGKAHTKLESLVRHYQKTGECLTQMSNAIIKTGVPRAEWELSDDYLNLNEQLGKGAFGEVFKGTLHLATTCNISKFPAPQQKNSQRSRSPTLQPTQAPPVIKSTQRSDTSTDTAENIPVAVKTCDKRAAEEVMMEFLQEARLQRLCRAEGVLNVIGVSITVRPIKLVLELCNRGSLLELLRDTAKPVSHSDKFGFLMDIATGMQTVTEKHIIHRDIACRNCLLSSTKNEKLTAKLADFGLARQLDKDNCYIPNKPENVDKRIQDHYAISHETLLKYANGKWTELSDVWSFAILIWEVFMDGAQPYGNLNSTHFCVQLETGIRLVVHEKNGMPSGLKKLMTACYSPPESKCRPTFTQIKEYLHRIKTTHLAAKATADTAKTTHSNPRSKASI